jgi:hypothetical protein
MKDEIKFDQVEMEAAVSAILQKIKSWQEEMKAYPEKQEANPEEMNECRGESGSP